MSFFKVSNWFHIKGELHPEMIWAISKKMALFWDILSTQKAKFQIWYLKAHLLIFLPNKIRLNLINTFVMSRNKHISKKTRCFSRKRSKNKAKPNEFERRILKLSCYACSDNPICRHAFSMFRNVSRMNSDLRCITETSSATLQ